MDPYKQILQIKSMIQSFFSRPLIKAFFDRILFVKKDTHSAHFFARVFLYAILILCSLDLFKEINFAVKPYGSADNINGIINLANRVNLVFHEAGHWVFAMFGRFMAIFGGTLLQCLIPIIVITQFLRQKDNFDASIGLWWLGHNFLGIAPYIYDAWDRKLILLGGVTGRETNGHDWHNLLTMTNRLDKHDEIAYFMDSFGKFILFLSFLWGAVILYKWFLVLKTNGFKKRWDLEEEDLNHPALK